MLKLAVFFQSGGRYLIWSSQANAHARLAFKPEEEGGVYINVRVLMTQSLRYSLNKDSTETTRPEKHQPQLSEAVTEESEPQPQTPGRLHHSPCIMTPI